MEFLEKSRIMAFDLAYSVVNYNEERVIELIRSSISMGPEHTRSFMLFFVTIFDGIQESIRDQDPEHHDHICETIKNPPQLLLDRYRDVNGGEFD